MSGSEQHGSDHGIPALARRMLMNAFRYRPAQREAISELGTMRHDADLLPNIERQLDRLFDPFQRDTAATCDIQGLRDNGVDLVVITTANGEDGYIGLQVKSHKEFKEEDQSTKLIRQHHEALQHFGDGLRYLILLGADTSDRTVAQRVRQMHSTFHKTRGVDVIDPRHLAMFLQLRQSDIDALLTVSLRSGDPILQESLSELQELTPIGAAILLSGIAASLLDQNWNHQSIVSNSYIQHVAHVCLWHLDPNDTTRESRLRAAGDEPVEVLTGCQSISEMTGLSPMEMSSLLDLDFAGGPGELESHPEASMAILEPADDLGMASSKILIPWDKFPATTALMADSFVRHQPERQEMVDIFVTTLRRAL